MLLNIFTTLRTLKEGGRYIDHRHERVKTEPIPEHANLHDIKKRKKEYSISKYAEKVK